MRKNNLYSRFTNKYFDEGLSLRVQAFHLLAFVGTAAGIIAAGVSFATGAAANVPVNLAMSALALFFVHRARKKDAYEFYYRLTVIVVFIAAFPFMFFAGGGYHSGMPCFFILALVFTALMLDKAERVAALASEFAIYAGVCVVAYLRPDTVTFYTAEAGFLTDVLTGIAVSGALILLVILLYVRIYDNRQKQLEELDKMKTQFMQSISHELKIPLSNIRNFALDTLKELGRDRLNIPAMEYDQNVIRVEGQRLIRMVSQLLDVTAIEGGLLKIHKESVSLAALLRRTAETSESLISENGNRTALEIADGLPDVSADPDIIGQVILNLIGNAARHTKDGIITLRLTAGDGYQEVCVADTGEGIHPDVQSQVFLRYIERENTMSGHNGLGLYICKRLIDAHGGETGIESGREKGAAVWFRLPAGK